VTAPWGEDAAGVFGGIIVHGRAAGVVGGNINRSAASHRHAGLSLMVYSVSGSAEFSSNSAPASSPAFATAAAVFSRG